MNKVILMGRLTRDPDIRYTQGENQMCIARYTLAVDRRYKQQNSDQDADFISCVAFGRSGEFAEKYLAKGTKIAVVGRLQTGSYTNKEGQTVYTTDVVVEEQYFAESKQSSQPEQAPQAVASGRSTQRQAQPQRGQQRQTQQRQTTSRGRQPSRSRQDADGWEKINAPIDEELPFT